MNWLKTHLKNRYRHMKGFLLISSRNHPLIIPYRKTTLPSVDKVGCALQNSGRTLFVLSCINIFPSQSQCCQCCSYSKKDTLFPNTLIIKVGRFQKCRLAPHGHTGMRKTKFKHHAITPWSAADWYLDMLQMMPGFILKTEITKSLQHWAVSTHLLQQLFCWQTPVRSLIIIS